MLKLFVIKYDYYRIILYYITILLYLWKKPQSDTGYYKLQ